MKKRVNTLVTIVIFAFLFSLRVHAATTVAQIGSRKYSSLEKAFSEAEKGQTVILKDNVAINGNLELNLGTKFVTLDLNKKKLSVKKSLKIKKGELVIKGNGTINAHLISNTGTLTVKHGTINSTVYNTGTFNLNGGELRHGKDSMTSIVNEGKVNMTGGTIICNPTEDDIGANDGMGLEPGAIILEGSASLKISGGKIISNVPIIWAFCETKTSTVNISGGTFKCNGYNCIEQCGEGVITISGGDYSVSNGSFIEMEDYDYDMGTINIKGGKITSAGPFSVNYRRNGKINISGGTFITTMREKRAMFEAFGGRFNITGGRFVAKNKIYAYMANERNNAEVKISNRAKLSGVKYPSIKLNKTEATIYTSGATTVQLKATVDASETKTKWSTSNKAIATVDSKGKVTAKKAGTVVITGRSNGVSAKCTVTVKKKNAVNVNTIYKNYLARTWVSLPNRKDIYIRDAYFTTADVDLNGTKELLVREGKDEYGNDSVVDIFTVENNRIQYVGAISNVGNKPQISSYGGIYNTWFAAGCAHFYLDSIKNGRLYRKVSITRISDPSGMYYYSGTARSKEITKTQYDREMKKYEKSLKMGQAFQKNNAFNREWVFG